jgi:hypothetical protein
MHRPERLDVNGLGPTDAPWLHPVVIDAVARRMLELARENGTPTEPDHPPDLLTVAEVADRLKMTPKWVYAHQRRLGVIKLGDGPKARLRFDPRIVDAQLRLEQHLSSEATDGVSVPRPTEQRRKGRRRLTSRPVPPTAMRRA